MGFAHQINPALEQRTTHRLHQHPAVQRAEGVRRPGSLGAVQRSGAIDAENCLLNGGAIHHGQGGAEQGAFNHLALAGLLPFKQGGHGAEGAQAGGAEVHKGRIGFGGLLRRAGKIHGPRHSLAQPVETDAAAVRATAAEGRDHGQDDVRLDGLEAVIVQRHGRQCVRRQVGNHHIGGGHQTAHDFLPLGLHGVERHAQFVAAHLHEQRAFARFSHRREISILTALDLFDANDLRSEIRQQTGAERPGNVAAKIQYAYPFENLAHEPTPACDSVLRARPNFRRGAQYCQEGRGRRASSAPTIQRLAKNSETVA